MNELEKVIEQEPDSLLAPAAGEPALTIRIARSACLRGLAQLREGRLTIRDWRGNQEFGAAGGRDAPEALVRVLDPSMYVDLAAGGTIGAAEAYMQGKWSTPDPIELVRLFVRNRKMMDDFEGGIARFGVPLLRVAHGLKRNSRRGSRRNIHAHYDLGDALFALFLDPTMMYSSAIFPRSDSSLDEAAVHKLDVICRKLELRPEDHLLEIGTGWGGLAIYAARNYGCRVTTTTISQNQLEYARRRVREAGLEDRVEVISRDYRDLDGQYDKLVSVEMIEAVGHEFLETYFEICARRLRPAGRMLLQAIVIADRHYEQARRSVDFIQKYIFPGGALPSLGSMLAAIGQHTDLQLTDLQDIGLHYARTLACWRQRFLSRLRDVQRLGYPDEFVRMWEWYLAYCEGGFRERAISGVHLVLDKPFCRLPAPAGS